MSWEGGLSCFLEIVHFPSIKEGKIRMRIVKTPGLYSSARNIVRRLRPEVLDTLGLQGAVEEMLNGYDAPHPNCRFEFNPSGDFSKLEGGLAIAAYRLVQEALSNIVKHAAASKVSVSLFVDDEENALYITVSDNGAGFDPATINSGIGIIGMRERVFAFNGQMEIMTKAGIGTAIAIQLPVGLPFFSD
jgi:two-component system sensor histidine kinase UhpB